MITIKNNIDMNIPRTIPAIVRGFFTAFVEGIVEGSLPEADGPQKVEPRQMKQLMLEHYEQMSQYLYESIFDSVAIVCYKTPEQLEKRLREADPTSLNAMTLMQHACRTEQAFQLMADEYRRNFYAILSGHIMSLDEYFDVINEEFMPVEEGNIPAETAIRAVVKATMRGYQSGRRAVKADHKPNNVVCLYRLMAEGMQCLLHNSTVEISDDSDLNDYFLAVCKTPENMNTMLESMRE